MKNESEMDEGVREAVARRRRSFVHMMIFLAIARCCVRRCLFRCCARLIELLAKRVLREAHPRTDDERRGERGARVGVKDVALGRSE